MNQWDFPILRNIVLTMRRKTHFKSPTLGKGIKRTKYSIRQGQKSKLFAKTLTGHVKRHPDGFGFFIPDSPKQLDVYLPIKQMSHLMSNDRVKISVRPRGRNRKLFSGKFVELIQRFHKHVVGQYYSISENTGFIKDESCQWGEDLKVQLRDQQNISDGEWVQAEILSWPGDRKGFCGRITVSLGVFSDSLEDNIRVIQRNNILSAFTDDSLKEADGYSETIPVSVIRQRKSLKNLPFVTIDGQTAKDFDDAIYVCKEKGGGWKLYVSIADVSYYIPIGSALDKEAFLRGNSTYFPNFVVPMLPNPLSQNLCSLKPHRDRLVLTVEISFDQKGKQQSAQFYEAIIRSQCRLNYGQAQDIIEDGAFINQVSEPVRNNVINAAHLVQHLLHRRMSNYFIDLNIPETEVRLNKAGNPIDIIQISRLFSHQVIEELMLAANQAVAQFIYKTRMPSIYRVHDKPKSEDLKFLEIFLHNLGLVIQLSSPHLQKKISEIMKKYSHHPLLAVLNHFVLKCMPQALYKAERKNHFGLNFKCYTHFTSPIRRYSDLIVHRILKSVLKKVSHPYKKKELDSIAEMVSACERKSVKAERQIQDIKKARFIKQHLGQEMEGMICNITRFGFFVRLKLYDIEGLVHMDRLPGKWKFENSLLQLVSRRSKNRFSIGDFVLIQIISANINTGQIDFQLKKKYSQKEALGKNKSC